MSTEQLTELDQDRAEVTDFSGGARAYLIVHGPDRADVVEVPVDRETVIGRGADAQAQIDDARVSRRHARLRWADGSLFIDDLGSRNGTNVNGEILQNESRRARGGDCIRLAGRDITVAIVSMNEAGAANDERPPLSRPISRPHHDVAQRDTPDGVVIAEPSMARMFGFTRRVAATSTTVLIRYMIQMVTMLIANVSSGIITSAIAALERTVVRSETGSDFQNRMLRSRRSPCSASRQ